MLNFSRAMRNCIKSQSTECKANNNEAKRKAAAAKEKVCSKICKMDLYINSLC